MNTSNFPEKQSIRREKVYLRLESQLKSGVKNTSEGNVPLTKEYIDRIHKEMDTINKRIDPMARERKTKKHRRR